jgi:chromosome segregation ATPase
MRLKCEEEMNRWRRDKDREVEGLFKEAKLKDIETREKAEKLNYLELKNNELSKAVAIVERELMLSRENVSQLTDKINRLHSSEKLANNRL